MRKETKCYNMSAIDKINSRTRGESLQDAKGEVLTIVGIAMYEDKEDDKRSVALKTASNDFYGTQSELLYSMGEDICSLLDEYGRINLSVLSKVGKSGNEYLTFGVDI